MLKTSNSEGWAKKRLLILLRCSKSGTNDVAASIKIHRNIIPGKIKSDVT